MGPGIGPGRPTSAAPVSAGANRATAGDAAPAKSAGKGEPAGADLSRAGNGAENERLRAATRDFEAVFIQQMLSVMRETVPDGGLLDGGQSEEIFSSLLDEHLAGLSVGEGRGGLADALYRHFVESAP